MFIHLLFYFSLGWVRYPKPSVEYVEYARFLKTGIEIAASSSDILSGGINYYCWVSLLQIYTNVIWMDC